MSELNKTDLIKTTFIYTLSDDSGIRYVGKSNFPNKRYYNHIKTCNRTNTYKNNWIKSLLNECKKPILNIIDEVPITEWQFWEKYWISKLRSDGNNLTNISIGGNGLGSHGYNTKERMKIRHKEFPNYNRSGGNLKNVIDKDLLYQLYIIENLSINKISKKLKFGKKKIWDSLQEYNISKSKSDWKHQLSTQPKKIVLQYDKSGNFIKEWIGLSIIQDEIGVNKSNISSCCRGIVVSAGDFTWRYKDEFIEIDTDRLNYQKRKVKQYDKSGNLIKEYDSIKETISDGFNDSNVQLCCSGRQKSHKGSIWRYSEDSAPNKYKNKTIKSVIQYDKNMNKIKVWDSISSVTKELDIGSNSITTCCKGKYKSAGGFIWRYKYESTN
jgi:hypothetical protein